MPGYGTFYNKEDIKNLIIGITIISASTNSCEGQPPQPRASNTPKVLTVHIGAFLHKNTPPRNKSFEQKTLYHKGSTSSKN